MVLVYGTCVAIGRTSVLLRGPSGSGKSDLALRLIDGGARLVADDQVSVTSAGGWAIAESPPALRGLLEVRGIGILAVPWCPSAAIGAVIDLVSAGARPAAAGGHPVAAFPGCAVRGVGAREGTARGGDGRRRVRAAPRRSRRMTAAGKPGTDLKPVRVVLVTGMSGAGKSTALKVLEDFGYEAIDNLPLYLLGRLLAPKEDGLPAARVGAIAIDVDIRTRDFDAEAFLAEIRPLAARADLSLEILFLDCDDNVLRRRFTETRRRHPLAADRPVIDGIAHERQLMGRLRDSADVTIDTTQYTISDFREIMAGHFALSERSRMTVAVTSFSYRRGLPREADLVFDVRFLSNPHYVETLRPLSGLDAGVATHVENDPALAPFFGTLTRMLVDLLPLYVREGKSYLTIAIGCTGGRHRSVYVAERLGRVLREAGTAVAVRHRDLDQATAGEAT
jgi:RNase adaptor protein for sRNA GlmZ degradation